MIYITAHN